MRFILLLTVLNEGIQSFVDSWKSQKPEGLKILLRPHISAEPINDAQFLTVVEADNMKTITDYCKLLESYGAKVQLILTSDDRSTSKELRKFYNAKKQAERHNSKAKTLKLQGMGSTKRLTVLPLIDWHTNNKELMVETGVSYLVKTDNNTILLDTGLNSNGMVPSPLTHNMMKLGIKMDEVDTIFITHKHGDHVGGNKWSKDKTFSITGSHELLKDIRVIVPTEMSYPGLKPLYAHEPMILGMGVATTGTIANSMYLTGFIEEQSLIVNVEGKGMVIIVGCGHNTIPRLLERARAIIDEPIYGLIGGLHYPVMGGPTEVYGYAGHKYGGTGKPPWEHITVEELNANIELLKDLKLRLVALSPHDSSDFSIRSFKSAFPDVYLNLRVGEPIIIG